MLYRTRIYSVVLFTLCCAHLTQASDADFTTKAKPFLENYCLSCHDKETAKGDVSLDGLGAVTVENASMWKRVWEQVALKEMPPRNKKNQPELTQRLEISNWITVGLSKAMKDHGGYNDYLRPTKANHLDHALLFGATPKNLAPSSTPARIWRIHPQEQLVRYNELICREADYDPKRPFVRTRGDAIVPNLQGELKVYFGLDNYIGHVGGTAAYAASVTGFSPILSMIRDPGLRNYPFLYSVNSSEATQVASIADSILYFMAYGPKAEPYQFADNVKDIPEKYKDESKRGLPTAIFYSKESKRPLTPLYDLMKNPGVSDERLITAINFLFEALTLRPPKKEETAIYLSLVKKSINDLGKDDGTFLGLTAIFLDRDALFRPELGKSGKPDQFGRSMLEDDELMLAINGAFSYIRPDDKLKTAMVEGRLKNRDDVKREVTRILNDDSIRKPRVLQFFREYFDYDRAASICKDDKALKKAGGEAGKSYYATMTKMIANTDALVELVVHEDKNVLKELLTTNRVIIDASEVAYFRNIDVKKEAPSLDKKSVKSLTKEDLSARKEAEKDAQKELFKRYFPNSSEPIFIRQSQFIQGLRPELLTTTKTDERIGMLTQPSWLVSHSDAVDNHAISRGRWIRERLLGGAVPDIPITVDAKLPDEPTETLRHRMRVTQEDYCWRCHQKMDPLGLPFERYNHIGLLRDKEEGRPVDTRGEIILSGDPALDGPVKDPLEMINKLAASERVNQVFVRHVFRYWMGRNETINDAPILQEAYKAYRDNHGSMKALLTSLLTSDAFLYRKVVQ